jgi:triacylglycerol esterase/lipase EstA (alpha/beta hydrolase family)
MKPTIVYIHGLNCTSRIFNYLQDRLPEHDAILINYDSTGRVEDSYESIITKIPKAIPIVIISHSLGGILGHLIATRNNGINVKKLITMSTPFGGSALAAFLKWVYPHYEVLKDIAPTCKIIQEVNNSNPTCKFLSFVTTKNGTPYISGANDGVVTIKSQVLCTPSDRIFVDSNHFEVVQDKNVFYAIKNFVF